MSSSTPSFVHRLWLAPVAFFRALFSGDFATQVRDWPQLTSAPALPPSESETHAEPREPTPVPPAPTVERTNADAALLLLGLLQREGRFIDFLQEEMSAFSDADIGAAARVVHTGCKKALDAHLTLEPVRSEDEGTRVTVKEGFDASEVRLTGNIVGDAPFSGTLQHRGWRATKIDLPQITSGHDPHILASAEVEL